jgi:hypothetical protein
MVRYLACSDEVPLHRGDQIGAREAQESRTVRAVHEKRQPMIDRFPRWRVPVPAIDVFLGADPNAAELDRCPIRAATSRARPSDSAWRSSARA